MSTRLEEANPYTDEEVEALALHGEEALREAILRHRPPAPRRRRWFGGWSIAGLTATAAAAATLAVVFLGGGAPERAWSAEAVRIAESVPRLLLPGWDVTRADEFMVDDGEMTFTRGAETLDLHWRGQRSFASWRRSRAHDSERLPDASVSGTTALVFRYDGTADDHTALWRSGPYTMELRGQMPAEEFTAALRSLREVDVDTWLSAMPASVVLPVDSDEVIDEMLSDIPLPDGFDRDALASDAVRDRYQLGARVSGAVACAWIAQWAGGDAAQREAAAAALGTSRNWSILHEMKAEGDYPEVLWEYAEAVAGDGTVLGGKVLSVEESYRDALGCRTPRP